jgi:predicted dithiol-disulfide oxidoreductase (DUF899 family)
MVSFPNESVEYRQSRNRLLQQETELRRITELVAAARRALPPGGVAKEDYVFDGQGLDGGPARVRLSELFAPGRDSLVIYSMMFPVIRSTTVPALRAVKPRCCRSPRARAHRAPPWWTSLMGQPSTQPSG